MRHHFFQLMFIIAFVVFGWLFVHLNRIPTT